MLSTNQASKVIGISKRSLQYYDDLQLIHVPRDANNNRLFDKETMERIWKILWYKELGFTLQEIKDLIQMDESSRIVEINKKFVILQEAIKEQERNLNILIFILENDIPTLPSNLSATFSQEIRNMKQEMNQRSKKL